MVTQCHGSLLVRKQAPWQAQCLGVKPQPDFTCKYTAKLLLQYMYANANLTQKGASAIIETLP